MWAAARGIQGRYAAPLELQRIRYDVIKWPQKLQSDQAHTENPEATRGKKNIRVFEQPQTKQLTERVE